ncbi:hypothetical protein K438DRAFT_1778707 [Mycena galopus ATCC 62051]|nr:hypothetical protein K438DRAFT_1778707 [Mycena galopus ATCC 62051]
MEQLFICSTAHCRVNYIPEVFHLERQGASRAGIAYGFIVIYTVWKIGNRINLKIVIAFRGLIDTRVCTHMSIRPRNAVSTMGMSCDAAIETSADGRDSKNVRGDSCHTVEAVNTRTVHQINLRVTQNDRTIVSFQRGHYRGVHSGQDQEEKICNYSTVTIMCNQICNNRM